MTLSPTRGTELTIAQVVLRSYQLAGLMNTGQGTSDPTWTTKLSFGKDMLQSLLASLQNEGIFSRQTIFYYLPLTAPTSPTEGTYIYAFPPTVFDVVGTGMYIDTTNTDVTQATGETPVLQKDRDTWQRMSSKAAQARPILYYCDRTVFPVQVYLWPVPSEAGTIRFQVIQLPTDSADGNATLDLERYWMDFVLWELSSRLAIAHSLPADRVAVLGAQAVSAKVTAKSYSHQHVAGQAHVMHGGSSMKRRRR